MREAVVSSTVSFCYIVGGVTTIAGMLCIAALIVLGAVVGLTDAHEVDLVETFLLAGSLLFFVGPLISFIGFIAQERELLRSRRWASQGRCGRCGYDLRGGAVGAGRLCPECGAGDSVAA